MRRFIDLHTHSTASDGACPPQEVVRLADAKRLAGVALTDHDTTDGLAPARKAAAEFPDLVFVGGLEISAQYPTGTLHILGLLVDEQSKPLAEVTQLLRAARDERNPKIIRKLQQTGLSISMADVEAAAHCDRSTNPNAVVGRLHIAQALHARGYVKTSAEAFDRYIGSDGPAFVDKERLAPSEAISAIRQAGGVAVLAHPLQLKCQNLAQLECVVRGLIDKGLQGIEVYHTDHSLRQTRHYLDLAHKYKLFVTGGSDFHGQAKPEALMGLPRVPASCLEQILQLTKDDKRTSHSL